jgi:hypothetical protein
MRQGYAPQRHPKPRVLAISVEETLHGVARYREGESPRDHTVDPDNAPPRIGQRTPRVAGSEADIRSDPSLPMASIGRAERMDDADGQRPDDP